MSKANYIIICNGRTQALAANDPKSALMSAAQCAAAVVNNLSLGFPELSQSDVKPVSDLLHKVMGRLAPHHWSPEKAIQFFGSAEDVPPAPQAGSPDDHFNDMCQLFSLCDALSEKFEGSD